MFSCRPFPEFSVLFPTSLFTDFITSLHAYLFQHWTSVLDFTLQGIGRRASAGLHCSSGDLAQGSASGQWASEQGGRKSTKTGLYNPSASPTLAQWKTTERKVPGILRLRSFSTDVVQKEVGSSEAVPAKWTGGEVKAPVHPSHTRWLETDSPQSPRLAGGAQPLIPTVVWLITPHIAARAPVSLPPTLGYSFPSIASQTTFLRFLFGGTWQRMIANTQVIRVIRFL